MRKLLLTLAVLTVACFDKVSVTTTYDLSTTHDLSTAGATSLEVHTDGGDITVIAGSSDIMHVEAERVAFSVAEARDLHVTVDRQGNLLRVRWDGPDLWDRTVSFRVTLPATIPVRLDTDGGNVRIDNMSSDSSAQTRGGDVSVSGHRGAINATTKGGNITCDGVLRGASALATNGGNVNVTLPSDSRLQVRAHSDGGAATNEFGIPTRGWPVPGDFEGTLGDGSDGTLDLRSDGGHVTLRKGR